LRHVDFHLTHECLGPPHSPRQTTARSLYTLHTMTQQSPHWLQWDAANSPQTAPSFRRLPPKSNTPIPSPTPLTTPNGIRIQSAILPQYRCADRQTWDDMVNQYTHNSALLSYSDSERRANNIKSSINIQKTRVGKYAIILKKTVKRDDRVHLVIGLTELIPVNVYAE